MQEGESSPCESLACETSQPEPPDLVIHSTPGTSTLPLLTAHSMYSLWLLYYVQLVSLMTRLWRTSLFVQLHSPIAVLSVKVCALAACSPPGSVC